jgi:hypothetical protein
MKKMFNLITALSIFALLTAFPAFAGSNTAGHSSGSHDSGGKEQFGELIHESKVDGYMLSYYFMDLRENSSGDHGKAASHSKEMDKPHHLMVYIMDKNHKQVAKGKVGFLIKDAAGNSQKAMGMSMSDGFGITADMKQKGVYTIVAKAVLGNTKLMDSFEYKIE